MNLHKPHILYVWLYGPTTAYFKILLCPILNQAYILSVQLHPDP